MTKAQLIFLYFPIRTVRRKEEVTKCHQYSGSPEIRTDIMRTAENKTVLVIVVTYRYSHSHYHYCFLELQRLNLQNQHFSSNTAETFSR